MGQSGTVIYHSYGVTRLHGYRVVFVTHSTRVCGFLSTNTIVQRVKKQRCYVIGKHARCIDFKTNCMTYKIRSV